MMRTLLLLALVVLQLLVVAANAVSSGSYTLLAGQEPCPGANSKNESNCKIQVFPECQSASYYYAISTPPPYAFNDVRNVSQLVAIPFAVPTNHTFQVSGVAAQYGLPSSPAPVVNVTTFNLSVTFYAPNETDPLLPGLALAGWEGGRSVLFTATNYLFKNGNVYRIEASLNQAAFNLSQGTYFFQLAYWGTTIGSDGRNTIQNYATNKSDNYPYYTGITNPPKNTGSYFPGSRVNASYTWQRDLNVTGGYIPCLWPTGTLFAPQSNNNNSGGGGDNGGGGGDNGGGGGDNGGGGSGGGGSGGDGTNPANFVVQFTLLGSLNTWDAQPFVSTMHTLLNSSSNSSSSSSSSSSGNGKRQTSEITVVLSGIKTVQTSASVATRDTTDNSKTESGVAVEFFVSGINGLELMNRALRVTPEELAAAWPNATMVGMPVAVGATSSDLSAGGQLGGVSLQLVAHTVQWLLSALHLA